MDIMRFSGKEKLVAFSRPLAASAVLFGSAELPNPLKATSVAGIFTSAIDLFLLIGFVGAGILLVYGGIQMIAAFGAEERLRNAKQTMTWAIIGLLVLLFAKAIEITIRKFLGAV